MKKVLMVMVVLMALVGLAVPTLGYPENSPAWGCVVNPMDGTVTCINIHSGKVKTWDLK